MRASRPLNGNNGNDPNINQIINLMNINGVNNKVNHLLTNVQFTGGEMNIKVILTGTLDSSGIRDIVNMLNFEVDTIYHFRWGGSKQPSGNHTESVINICPFEVHLQTQANNLSRQIYNWLLDIETNVERVQLGYKPLFFSMKYRLVKEDKRFNLHNVIDALQTLMPTSWNLSYEVLNDSVEYVQLVLHVDKRK